MEKMSLAIVPKSVDECTDLAERLSKSSLIPKGMQGKMPDVLVTIMAGQEMGLAPMASLRAFHVIEGKPVMAADGMVAVILGSGKAVYFERIEATATSATYETLRVGAKAPKRCTWTIEQAKIAGLHLKDNWRAHPRAMLASRAKSELARDVYADVLMGVHTDDEVGDFERPEYVAESRDTDVIDAEIVGSTTEVLRDFIQNIELATSEDSLKSLAKVIKEQKFTGSAEKEVKEAYGAKLKELRSQPAPSAEATEQTA